MNVKCWILICLVVLSSIALGQQTAVEHDLSLKTRPQYYDQSFQGTLAIDARNMDLTTLHSTWAQYMSDLDRFMKARRMRLDNLVNLSSDWFHALEKAYSFERSISTSYNSIGTNPMKSLIGFKSLNNFIGALIWTKAQQNLEYKTALMRALNEKKYLERLMGVVADSVAGTPMEAVVGRDLVAQLTSKTGSLSELDRMDIASYPISKNALHARQLRAKTLELLKGHKALQAPMVKSCRAVGGG